MLKFNFLQYILHTGAIYIAEILKKNKKLKHFNIGSNKISDDGVKYVSEGLLQNHTLNELMLHDCKISEKGN